MADRDDSDFSAWNPGLEADLPWRYKPLETIYRSANLMFGISLLAYAPSLTDATNSESQPTLTARKDHPPFYLTAILMVEEPDASITYVRN